MLYLSEQVRSSEIAKVIHPLATVLSELSEVRFVRRKNKRYRLMECSEVRGSLQPPFFYIQPQHTLLEAYVRTTFTSVATFTYHEI